MKWVGLAILLFVGTFSWFGPAEGRILIWVLRPGGLLGAALTFFDLQNSPADPRLAELLAKVPPTEDTVCPFCGNALLLVASPYCPKGGVRRL